MNFQKFIKNSLKTLDKHMKLWYSYISEREQTSEYFQNLKARYKPNQKAQSEGHSPRMIQAGREVRRATNQRSGKRNDKKKGQHIGWHNPTPKPSTVKGVNERISHYDNLYRHSERHPRTARSLLSPLGR